MLVFFHVSDKIFDSVIFALFGTVVNAAIGLHCWCSRTPSNDNIGTDHKGTKRKPVTEKYHCLCSAFFLTLCLMFITMCVTEYLTISDDKIVYESSAKLQPYMHTIVIVGYILGSIGAVSYWFSKFYEIVESYRQTRHRGVHTCMYLTAITGDTTYLIGVYIQMSTFVYIIKTLPWTLARMGLIGIHVGIIFQRSCSSSQQQTDDNVTLLKESRKSDESDWSDDSSTVICGTCDLQTSVKQIICRESPLFDKEITLYEKGVTEKVYYDKGDNPAINKDTTTNMESASSESPELEWDFEWSSDTKKRQFSKMDINKVSSYNGYYKVVECYIKREAKDTKGTFNLTSRKQTDNAMAKKKRPKDKQQYTKHNIENQRLDNTNPKTEDDLRCSGRVSRSCSTCGTRRVAQVSTNQVTSLIR
ncbi:unnamed protein product [Mytilus coruscus]|uniref:Uncharacterized protein n=1 Tax=Mytilus coruscus TaxID=42192 RepID=A0A6J8BPS7_MYTCO|nr:unnamed protein product [Mytilus coruscus]